MLAKFPCPGCGAVLIPAQPQPSGTRVRCPKCAHGFAIPDDPRDQDVLEEVRTVEEPEPVRPSRSSRMQRASSSSQRSRFRDDEDADDEDSRPSRRSRPRQRSAHSNGAGLRAAILIGGVLFGILILSIGGWFLLSPLFVGNAGARINALNEATAILRTVPSPVSPQTARPALVAVGQRLRAFHEQDMAAMKKALDDPEAIKRAIDEAMRNPEKARKEAERLEREQKPFKEATQRLVMEMLRVNRVEGGKELLTAFFDACGEGGKMHQLSLQLLDRNQ